MVQQRATDVMSKMHTIRQQIPKLLIRSIGGRTANQLAAQKRCELAAQNRRAAECGCTQTLCTRSRHESGCKHHAATECSSFKCVCLLVRGGGYAAICAQAKASHTANSKCCLQHTKPARSAHASLQGCVISTKINHDEVSELYSGSTQAEAGVMRPREGCAFKSALQSSN